MMREADDGNGWTVMLDYRTLKRPSKRPLKLPSLIGIGQLQILRDKADESANTVELFGGSELVITKREENKVIHALLQTEATTIFSETHCQLSSHESAEASASFVNSGGTRAIVEILGAFLETLIKETGCEVSSMKLLYMHLSDRKPVEKEDEIIVMVVPDYKMLKYVEKIAKDLQMTRSANGRAGSNADTAQPFAELDQSSSANGRAGSTGVRLHLVLVTPLPRLHRTHSCFVSIGATNARSDMSADDLDNQKTRDGDADAVDYNVGCTPAANITAVNLNTAAFEEV
ncbi:hypothetical protein F2Q70_00030455 [Brassica cretica]|uniref:Uncharacterized protein n=1 Tax=Brassica cretica TaxID=69181 RepID=A0A8S9FG22_BRACR|nr:hypothetical protein F2Q70_00030455 [Brassica cretica]